MANLIFDKAQIEATIDKIVDRTMRMDMTWDWPCGVAYYGICEAYEVTKNERYLQLVKDRVDEYIELGLPSWTVNTCSMGHCLITLYEHTGDEKYLDIGWVRQHTASFVPKRKQHLFVASPLHRGGLLDELFQRRAWRSAAAAHKTTHISRRHQLSSCAQEHTPGQVAAHQHQRSAVVEILTMQKSKVHFEINLNVAIRLSCAAR